MKFYSTNNPSVRVSMEEALLRSLPADRGLYMPETIPFMGVDFFNSISGGSLSDIGFQISSALFKDSIPSDKLEELVHHAFPFDTPVVTLEDGKTHVLELFHGPSLAFKDVGARYMAAMMGYFLEKSNREVHILVATSGDTGGAVAMGFLGVPGIKVTILYPSGRVSELQEKQLTTLGQNITAIEVDGSFDDCQALVKTAFTDSELNQQFSLASANSINIFRLIPQSFYYARAYGQVKHLGKPVVFSTPSGNFGNLSAGALAYKMGLPVQQFIASTNRNYVVPKYLETGIYEPKPSVETISNAMDVGAPSNFVRLTHLFDDNFEALKQILSGYYFDDEQTKQAMAAVYQQFDYVMCPHTAVGYLGLKNYQQSHPDVCGISLATAHPAKFKELVESVIHKPVEIPAELEELMNRPKHSFKMKADFTEFKEFLLQTA
ncbi:threonine synthase [Larkinella terrae]|uniref:Threonine synthase n=1 Tax=Larkinella terrae TaxID=2025311 RepID=A0A7K0EHV5_9BACT|nr:threonine synthase [Larkinella terrae]MRS61046.1 threonine synthase [Larkinella terrae]